MLSSLREKHGKVAVLMGGNSREREISLLSGNGILQALQDMGVDAHKFDPQEQALAALATAGFQRAVIALHGRNGEDGLLQGALEVLGIPYNGAGVLASSLALDKYRTKLIWSALAIPVAAYQYVLKKDYLPAEFVLKIALPVVVKPVREGSTIGLSKVFAQQDLAGALDFAFACDDAVLIEELIVGDEYSVTVADGKVYPVVKIEAPAGEYDYQNKYFTDETKYLCPFDLGRLHPVVEAFALQCYNALSVTGIARVDFMLDKQQQLYFLELNTLPGMTGHSLVPMAFQAVGIDYKNLCLQILDSVSLKGR